MSERILSVGGNQASRPLDDVRAKGVAAAYIKTDAGIKTLAAASPIKRKVIIVLHTTEVFAVDGANAAPTVKLGETDDDDKFAAATVVANNTAAGTTFTFAGELTANKALIATLTAAAGAATGAYSITAMLASAL